MQIPGLDQSHSKELISSISRLELDLSKWDQNSRIGGLLSRTVLSGGKRLRPLLTFLMADLFGIDHEQILPFARVVELVHAATLAHDDVIDNAKMRRGQPSINASTSNKHAVLAGDFLLAYAVDEVAKQGRNSIVQCLTQVIRELAEGEWLQLDISNAERISRSDIENVAKLKTGSVIRWCCQVPAIIANSSEKTITSTCHFGENLGIAFQLSDDIIDFNRRDGSEFADLKSGVVSSVVFEAAALQTGQDTIDKTTFDFSRAHELPIDDGIAVVSRYCQNKLESCREILTQIQDQEAMKPSTEKRAALAALEGMINYIANRVTS